MYAHLWFGNVLVLVSDDKLMLLGDYTRSKLFWVLPHVFNGPLFIFLTCETGVYLQVYIHFLTARGRLRSLKCSQVMGTHPALKRRKDGEDLEKTMAV